MLIVGAGACFGDVSDVLIVGAGACLIICISLECSYVEVSVVFIMLCFMWDVLVCVVYL